MPHAKRHRVQQALTDHPGLGDREIARQTGTSHTLVAQVRRTLASDGNVASSRKVMVEVGADLLERIDELAQRLGATRAGVIQSALRVALLGEPVTGHVATPKPAPASTTGNVASPRGNVAKPKLTEAQLRALRLIAERRPHCDEREALLLECFDTVFSEGVPRQLRRHTIRRTLRALRPHLEDSDEGDYCLVDPEILMGSEPSGPQIDEEARASVDAADRIMEALTHDLLD